MAYIRATVCPIANQPEISAFAVPSAVPDRQESLLAGKFWCRVRDSVMAAVDGGYFDPETIDAMRAALDEAWAALRPEQQDELRRAELAQRILEAAAQGERDRDRLRDQALGHQRTF